MSETKTKNLCTVPAADLTDSQYFIAEDGGELKRIPKAQVVLKKLENMLATDTENLAGGGEVTAQELLDALAEQVANKLLAKSQVVNNLLATVEGNPLDATQGKALKELIDTTNNNLSKYELEKTQDKVEFSAYSDDYKNSMIFGHTIDGNYYCKSRFDGTWNTVNLATKDDLSPTAESLTKPTSKGYTFSQWVAVAEKSGNTVTLTFNINGSMDASYDFVLLTTLPEKYRPKISHYHSYCTQEERSMVMIIYTDGKIMLFNNNRLASGLFLRQTISYPVA